MNKYVNYHKHSWYSNPITPDSAVSPLDYVNRIKELGHTVLSSVEHGSQLGYIEYYDLAQEYNLKYLFGVEAYFVKNRLADENGERDNTNSHLVLLAKNENGRKGINRILSQANIDGFYYRPRIDIELIHSLPRDDIWVTSGCIAGLFRYHDGDNLALALHNYFGNNFFLEVQSHHVDKQVELNKRLINLSNRYGIPIIAGVDSHYIYPNQAIDRDDFLLSRGVKYEDEEDWFMDYPDYDTLYQRFDEQGVLTSAQIEEAISNTNVFEVVEEYDSPIFKRDMKLPTIYPDMSQDDKDALLTATAFEAWEREKINVPQERWDEYVEEIKKELQVIIDTGMSDYFLLNHEVVKKAVANGGMITLTGRGSSVSYMLSKLLGFSTVDRINAEVKLFPERFMTRERILQAGSLPDLDMNLGNPEVFAQAQKDLLGEDHSYPMIAYGTAQPKASWKMYARAKGLDFQVANKVSSDIEKYERALASANDDDERQSIKPLDYIEQKYHSMYQESEKYQGTITDAKVAPCGYLIYDRPISEEIGLIKLKDSLCTVMDGRWGEAYNFLKNDLLKVSVVELIYNTYKRIGIEPHTLPELIRLCDGNDKVWDVYHNAWTMGINQLEQPYTSGMVASYKPTNISELSAFVAAVRPGFKSYYKRFEAREPFEFGVPSLDNLIQTEQFKYSYMLYQENAMQVMQYAGIPISETYEVVKNIAKKRAEKVYKYKDIFTDGMTKRLIEDEKIGKKEAEKIAHDTWQVIEDSAFYSFNACFDGNTIIDTPNGDMTINDLYHKQDDNTFVYSVFPNGTIKENKVEAVLISGIQETYRVTTMKGGELKCTINHRFPTVEGDKPLSEIKVNDVVFFCPTGHSRELSMDIIRSIKPTGKSVLVYDIVMASPAHNVIVGGGVVASNSHAYSVAGDSLYGAYLKSHYPLEFYETLMRQCEQDGDKDRLALVKNEARRAYKIKFPPLRFGQDNRSIVGDKDKWEITSSLRSIKGFGSNVGDDMWDLSQRKYKDFLEFLVHAEEQGKLYSYIEKLISIQFFEEFGGNQKLLDIYNEFTSGKNRYKRTHTDATKEKRFIELKKIWDELEDRDIPVLDQLKIDFETTGAIQARYNIPVDYLYAMEVDDKYAPRVETYCLKTGTVNSIKIRKNVFANKPFKSGDIIKLDLSQRSNGSLLYFKKEPRRRFENGTFVDDPSEFDWWANKYDIIDPNEFMKIIAKNQ